MWKAGTLCSADREESCAGLSQLYVGLRSCTLELRISNKVRFPCTRYNKAYARPWRSTWTAYKNIIGQEKLISFSSDYFTRWLAIGHEELVSCSSDYSTRWLAIK
jgi:hypothetical protein